MSSWYFWTMTVHTGMKVVIYVQSAKYCCTYMAFLKRTGATADKNFVVRHLSWIKVLLAVILSPPQSFKLITLVT